MRVAMFEGYGSPAVYGAAEQSAAVEETIRAQVQVMMQVQKTLWEAHGKWASGQFWIGIVIPAARLLQIGKFDWRYAVTSWQGSVDTWWGEKLTNAVRADPNAIGTDGKTRLEAWTAMAEHLITWARNIANEMRDDGVSKLFTDYWESFKYVLRKGVEAGLKLPISIIPPWVWWAAGGGLALALLFRFGPRR